MYLVRRRNIRNNLNFSSVQSFSLFAQKVGSVI